MDMGDACSTESVFGLLQHVVAIVQTGDVGLRHTLVFGCGKHGGTYGNIEHAALEIVGYPAQHPAGYLVVVDTAPEELEVELAPPLALRNSVVVEALAEFV